MKGLGRDGGEASAAAVAALLAQRRRTGVIFSVLTG